ncbi:MAG: 50S ribosomal protein L18e [Candidatus Bathyarchaeia archaeon]
MKRVKSTNPELLSIVRFLRKKSTETEAGIWRDVAKRLSTSRRRRVAVNLSRLNRYTKAKETVIVPGKVLGAGTLDHPINVAAFTFSEQARAKILRAKGKCLSIQELMKKNLKGTNVKIMG